MLNWRAISSDALDEAVEAQKAAKRTAEKAAHAVILAWLERSAEIARESDSIAIFNQSMKAPYHMLGERESSNIQHTLENGEPHAPTFIGHLREQLLARKEDFPFPVIIQRDIGHPGRYYFVAVSDFAD